MTKNRLGLLGGGQLARMLALSAYPLGLQVSVLAGHPDDPAAQVCGHSQIGSLDNEAVLKKFLQSLDAVTFESEFVDTELMTRCLPPSVHVFPRLSVIAAIQDRLTQKQLLDKWKIPTSAWMPIETATDLRTAAGKFPGGLVLKQRRYGYDGYGTMIVRDPKRELSVELLSRSPHGFIAEELIDFSRELAISYVRGPNAFLNLPLVESVQQNARCFSVRGPVKHKHINKITNLCKKVMQDLDYRGILAVELFDTPKGLLVNELAPRVHNSAHYSLDALTCSQFAYHLRAGLDLPLPKLELLRPGFAMVNLLADGGPKVHLARGPAGHLHWYGKNENRKGRKMGHLNVLAGSSAAALKTALKWRKEFQL